MSNLDYQQACKVLERALVTVESAYLTGRTFDPPPGLVEAFDHVFNSSTQAFREVLLGCAVARLMDGRIDVRLPYADQGDRAFSGRSLDERVINPFLQSRRIPSSKGPYLSVFRRSVTFTEETGAGIRDKIGYKAFLWNEQISALVGG